jgi:hypothetical protein
MFRLKLGWLGQAIGEVRLFPWVDFHGTQCSRSALAPAVSRITPTRRTDQNRAQAVPPFYVGGLDFDVSPAQGLFLPTYADPS